MKKKKYILIKYHSRIIHLVIILTSMIILSLLFFSSHNRENAQITNSVCQTLPVKVPVVVMGYFPPDPNNPTQIDPLETGWTTQKLQGYSGQSSMTLQQWQNNVTQMATTMSQVVSDATRYHGYKNPSAPEFLSYQILTTKYFNKPIPHSTFTVSESPNNPVRPDYNKTMQDLGNVCNYVDGMGVKEIWVYGYHSTVVSPDESRLSSNFGDVSNSFPHDPGFPVQFRLPKCQNSYIMYNFEMWPAPSFIDNTVHNRMHQIENEIGFAAESSNFQITWPSTPWSASNMFWHNFAAITTDRANPSCGNTHVPSNTLTPYDYANHATVNSNCETWNPDLTKSTFSSLSCQNWGCTTLGFYKWWMQNLPGYNNGIVYLGSPMRNWWEAMYNYNAFISAGRSLFGNSIFTCVVTPTPQSTTPTLTPTLLPTVRITPTPVQLTTFATTVCPHGIGNCGDNANPTSQGTLTPIHSQRDVTITIFNGSNQQVGSAQQMIQYKSTSFNFQGPIIAGNIPSGQYLLKIKMDGLLPKQYPGIFTINSNQTITLPSISLITGDINNDGQLDILDYNLLINCFGSKQNTPSCATPPSQQSPGSDITDDGIVNGADYNLFLRELSVQHGG